MNVNPSIFKAYDIRGIYQKDIDEEVFRKIARAIYTFFSRDMKKKGLVVVIGRDMRLSSPSLHKVAKEELIKMGAHVLDIGLVPTPTVYFAGLKLQADVVIQVSASHNPKEYAGAKFAKRIGDTLSKVSKVTGMEEVKRIVLENDFDPYAEGGDEKVLPTLLADEVDSLLTEYPKQQLKPFKAVADVANAMGALFLTELYSRIPGELVRMNFELDGSFPVHQPDPLEFKNLVDLQAKVKAEHADLGIAPDGDGDRIFFVDEKGEVIPATLITALVARELLNEVPGGKIIADIRYTRNAENQVKKYGGKMLYSQVGHALITAQVNKEGALFAGESSGHFYFKKNGGAESSLRVLLILLTVMSRENKPLSEIVKELHTSYESSEFNFVLEAITPKEVTEKIKNDYKDGELSELDGISISYPDWRFNIRSSNTEPLLRLNIESDNDDLTKKHLADLTQKIIGMGAKPKTH